MKKSQNKTRVLETGGKFEFLLKEDGFEAQMNDIAEPYLSEHRMSGELEHGGMRLYYELYTIKNPQGTVVFSFGFTESCVKYYEFLYYLLRSGYQCAIMDHRGHGRSAREGKDPNVVHVRRFQDYVEDLHQFVEYLKGAAAEGVQAACPLYLYGHSMGGCIAAEYLEAYPDDFDRAILNAPMLGLKLGGCPPWAAALLCDINILAGRGERRLFYQHDFNAREPFEGSSAGSRARFDYYLAIRCAEPAFQTSSASYRWAREAIRAGRKVCRKREAGKVKIPVLLFQAGDDTLVKNRAQEKFAERIEHGNLIHVPAARHEIYRSGNKILEPYMAAVVEFFREKYN